MIYMRKKLQLVSECLHLYYGTFCYKLFSKHNGSLISKYFLSHIVFSTLSIFEEKTNTYLIGTSNYYWCTKYNKSYLRVCNLNFLGYNTKLIKTTSYNKTEFCKILTFSLFMLTWFYILLLCYVRPRPFWQWWILFKTNRL